LEADKIEVVAVTKTDERRAAPTETIELIDDHGAFVMWKLTDGLVACAGGGFDWGML